MKHNDGIPALTPAEWRDRMSQHADTVSAMYSGTP